MAEDMLEVLPAGPPDKPIEQWTLGELLTEGARAGLTRSLEVANWQPDPGPEADQKRNRLIIDAGAGLYKMLRDIHAAAMQAKKQDNMAALLDALRKSGG